jgi:hypothetical protein
MFVSKYTIFLERLFFERISGRKLELKEVQEPQTNIYMELELGVITFDVQYETKKTQELCRSGRTCYAPLRYQLLMEADDEKLLILKEPINYVEAICNIDSEKRLEAMKSEIDFLYTNQV